jgi:hypothetical protein
MTITVVTDQGTHLLITDGTRYAVIERRNDRLYNCHNIQRAGIAAKDIATVERILDSGDWTDRETARQTFSVITERGTGLAEHMR